ncbi:MAG: hypothetical protein JSU92_11445, partial [Deltaproteobacteria bacterium]
NVQVDTIAPEVGIASPSAGECIATSTVVVSGSVTESGSGVSEIRVQAGAFSATGISFPITLNITVDGLYDIIVQVEDNCGNIGSDTVTNVRVDTVAPVASISSPSAGECIGTSEVEVNGTVVEAGSGVSVITVEAGAFTATGASFPIILSIPADDVYTITVWAEDNCGNIGPKDTVTNVTVDTFEPWVTIFFPLTGECINSTTVVVTGDVFDPGISCGIDQVTVNGVDAQVNGGPWTAILTGQAEGTLTLVATATDLAGNSFDSFPEVITVDYALPTVSIIAPTDGIYLPNTMVMVSGTASDGTGSGISAVLVNGYTASGTDNWNIILTSDQYMNPIEVGSRDTMGWARGVFVSGDYAYVADEWNGLAIIDVSDPANPGTPVYRAFPPGDSRGVYVTGEYAYVADGPSGLAIIDVSDPENPGVPVYRAFPPGDSQGVYVTGGYAYVADGWDGLAIIDVSNPLNPGTPVYRDTTGFSGGVYVTGDYAYVADDSSLAIIDVSDPENPGTIVYQPTSGNSYGVYVTGGYAYVADGGSGLTIIDVRDPLNPFWSNNRDTSGDSRGVYVTGGYAYVADGWDGLAIIDVSDPFNPGSPVYWDTLGDSSGVHVIGGYAYVADGDMGGLRIIDVSSFNSPVFSAVAVDNCGNTSSPDTIGVTIDTAAPAITITLPTDGATLNQTTVWVRGSVNDPIPSSGIDYIMVNGQTASGTDPWIVKISGLAEGWNILNAMVRDKMGNEGMTFIQVFVDSIEPPPPVITFPFSGPTSDNTPRVEGFAEPGTTVEILEGVLSWGTTVADGGGFFAIVLPVLADGAHTLVATATDEAGNTSWPSNEVVIFVDTVEPDVFITSPVSGTIFSTNRVLVNGTVTDALPSSGISNVLVNGTPANVFGNNWDVILMGLSEGSVTIDVRAYDGAGNEGVAAVNITVDITAPTVSITLPTLGTTINQTTVLVKGTATDTPPSSGLKRVEVNGETASGTESWMVTVSGLAEGWNSITATVWDNADNYSSTSVSIFVDTIAPEVSISSPTVGGCINTEAVVVTGTITEAGSGVELVTVTAIGPAVFSATGSSFPVNLTVPIDGLYSISVQVSDEAGNSSPVVWVTNVRVDTVAPTGSVTSPADNECITVSTITVLGSASTDVVEITATWGAYSATAASFPVYIDVSGVAEGTTNDLVVSAVDDCGNNATIDTVTNVQVDTIAPEVGIASPSAGECIATSTVVVSG